MTIEVEGLFTTSKGCFLRRAGWRSDGTAILAQIGSLRAGLFTCQKRAMPWLFQEPTAFAGKFPEAQYRN
jgi:hypothetical protein